MCFVLWFILYVNLFGYFYDSIKNMGLYNDNKFLLVFWMIICFFLKLIWGFFLEKKIDFFIFELMLNIYMYMYIII